MGKGRPSEKGVHSRCIVEFGDQRCPRTDMVSYGLCGPHRNQKARGNEFTPVRFYRPRGLSEGELATWVVEVSVKAPSGCMEWPFALNGTAGYGVIAVGEGDSRVRTSPHRLVATHFHHGGVKLMREQVVHHMCANRKCINPEHLTITTATHNASEAQMRVNNRELHSENERLKALIGGCERCKLMSKLDDNGEPLYHDGTEGPEGKVKKSENYWPPRLDVILETAID